MKSKLGLIAKVLVWALATVVILPLVGSEYLRFIYAQTVARWAAKAVPPDTVYIGDSVTAGGRLFNDARDINLGSNGLQTFQIAAMLPTALALSPRHVVVMAGTNDAVEGPIDAAELVGLWRTICAEPKVVVTLVSPTTSGLLNARIAQLNGIARSQCAGRTIIDLSALADKDGRIRPQYTVDGTHLSPAGNAVWKAKLRRMGI